MGCAKVQNLSSEGTSAVVAPAKISESFEVETDAVGKITLSLHKKSLEKEFLLQGSTIAQTQAPTGNFLKSRIVAFRKIDGKLRMLEANGGHIISNDLPKTQLLASFPIVSEKNDRIQFDFNDGMSRILAAEEIRVTSDGHEAYVNPLQGFEARQAYIDRATILAENQLEVRQIMQTAETSSQYNTLEVRYFLSPYLPDPTYKPLVAANFDRVGFFSTFPVMRSEGYPEIFSTRFHPGKKITIAMSSNVPQEYKQAMRDGILYWNRILPNSPIEVIEAPPGVTAPSMQYNLVQWVNNDFADSAYADMLTDPRTGEILRGNAYITSTFAFGGIQHGRKFARYRRSNKGNKQNVQLKGFEKEHLCDLDSHDLDGALPTLAGKTDAQILQVAQDRIRGNVAHEVGHFLGFRHNFAGSTEPKNYPWAQRAEIFDNYIETSKVPEGIVTSNTVMDYPRFQERALIGNVVGQGKEVLDYDVVAAGVLYGEKAVPVNAPLFCTDSDAGKAANCQRHDVGATVAETAAQLTKERLASFPADIIEAYLEKTAGTLDLPSQSIASVSLLPKATQADIFTSRNLFFSSLTTSTPSLRHLRDFPYFGPLNEEKTKKKRLERMADEINEVGGLDKVLPAVPRTYYGEVKEQLINLLRDEHYLKGFGDSGQPYSLSPEDVGVIVENSDLLLKELEGIFIDEDISEIKKIPDTWKNPAAKLEAQVRQVLLSRIEQYVFETDGAALQVTIEDPKEKIGPLVVNLPNYYYKHDVREKASRLLEAPKSSKEWAKPERSALYDRYKATMDMACGCDFAKLKASNLVVTPAEHTDKVVDWVKHNQEILKNF